VGNEEGLASEPLGEFPAGPCGPVKRLPMHDLEAVAFGGANIAFSKACRYPHPAAMNTRCPVRSSVIASRVVAALIWQPMSRSHMLMLERIGDSIFIFHCPEQIR
jgi:hypothetical protein